MPQRLVGSIVLLLVIFVWGDQGPGEQAPAPHGERRVVDSNRYNCICA